MIKAIIMAIKVGFTLATMVLTIWFIVEVVWTYRPDWFTSVHSETRGEYMGFRIGMDRAEAVNVIKSQYYDAAGRLEGYNDARNRRRFFSPEDLLKVSTWQIFLDSPNRDEIELRFCGNELIAVTRHRNWLHD